MMTLNGAINILIDLAEDLHGMPDEALEDRVLTDPRYAKTEAIRLAVDILTTLEANRAKAEEIIAIEKICRSDALEDCEGCPYHMQGCTFKMELDADRLLELAYLQGDDSDDQT